MADKKQAAQTPDEVAAAQKFTEQDENRQLAFTKALELLRILNKDHLELEMSAQRPYTRTEVVKKTTLSHRTALELLETLSAFNYVKFFDANKTKFCFTFSPDDRAAVCKAKIIQLAQLLGNAVEGYKRLLLEDYPEEVYQRESLEMEKYLTTALEVKR